MYPVTWIPRYLVTTIDFKYYDVIWIDNGSTLPEADTWRPEGKYLMIKVLQSCILKLSLHSVNSVLVLYRTGNMQSAILYHSSPLPPYLHMGFNLATR